MNAPLEVHPPTVARSSVTMQTVVVQLEAISDILYRHCRLPSLAFGAVGMGEVRQYNDRCNDVGDQVLALKAKAENYSENLAHSAVAYVTAEDANLEAALYAFDESPAPADGAPNDFPAVFGIIAETGAARALTTAKAAALGDRMLAALQQTQFAKFGEAARMVHGEWVSASRQGIVYTDTPAVWSAERLEAGAMQRLSSIARLSQATDTLLALGRPWSMAALAAAYVWSSQLLCPSDYQIDVTVNAWTQIAKAARSVFDDEVEGIARSLFADWTDKAAWSGTASATAQTAFAEFQQTGRALADHAERMATFLTTLVQNLDQLHENAFYFASGQLVALIAYAVLSCFPTPAAVAAKAAVQLIGQVLREAVSVWVTIVSSLLGMLIEALGTFETVPGDSSWATA
jgi:hypothetical protein